MVKKDWLSCATLYKWSCNGILEDIDAFLKGYSRHVSKSDTDLSRFESDVVKLVGSEGERAKKARAG